MGISDWFSKKKKTKTEEIEENREKIKNTLTKNLTQLGFTNLEIAEVQNIINTAEEEIQYLKNSLLGSNINNPDAMKILESTRGEIRKLQEEMAIDIKKKVLEIKQRKAKFKKGQE